MADQSSSRTWVYFLAGANETALRPWTTDLGDSRLRRYRVQRVIPVRGEAPANLTQGWIVVRIESSAPISHSDETLSAASVIRFHGVTQDLQYTTDAQRQELDARSMSQLESSDHSKAVLIPIGKSEAWWILSRGQRQAYFQETDAREGHTTIGLKYAHRVFRKLYHSRDLKRGNYDFLTYFGFEDSDERNFRALLTELRETQRNPEWGYVNLEFEIWMTPID